jgi:hypothetical protein
MGKQLLPQVHFRQLDVIQQVSNHVAFQDAENYGFVYCRGGVLLCVSGRS